MRRRLNVIVFRSSHWQYQCEIRNSLSGPRLLFPGTI